MSPLFNSTLQIVDEAGLLEGYRVLDGGVLLAMDGVWYHSSTKIHCNRCLHMTKDGVTTYYHVALAGAIVKPGDAPVLPGFVSAAPPLPPAAYRPQGGGGAF